ncbi:hypothetical protein EV361DRAFT_901339 [Lentinula raphanica]|nr:hypothetical protein EV361DRAFT_901339 [Lentinula raphanica]
MTISFIPAIDEVVRVALPEWHTSDSTVQLRFSAVLGDDDFQQFKQNAMKVQLWSDIPFSGRNQGEWGEIDLSEVGSVSSSGSQVSLVDLDNISERTQNVLSVVCSVPFSGIDSYLSFTYRLIYSSGEIKWLGQFGRNGMVHLHPSPKNTSGIVFEEGLVENIAPFVWNTHGKQVEDLLIAELTHPEDWSIWAFGKDSLYIGPAANVSMAILVPRFRSYARSYCPKTITLSASSALSISVSASGKIQVSGSGSLLLHTFDPSQSADLFFDRIFTHNASISCRLLGIFGDYAALASTSPTPSVFVQVILVPLIPSGVPLSQAIIPTASLANILAAETAEFTIFSNQPRPSVHFVKSPVCVSPVSVSEPVQFSVPPFGGHFILTPLYSISSTNSQIQGSGPLAPKNSLSFSVLSPHSVTLEEDTAAVSAEDAILPTPPPSPHLHPIAHLTSPSYNHSTTSISELGEQDADLGSPSASHDTQEDTSISEFNSLHTLRPPIVERDHGSLLTRQSSPSLLIEAYRENRENIMMAFMRNIYFVFTLWFSLMFQKVFGGSAPSGTAEGISDEHSEERDNSGLSSPARSGSDTGDAGVNERTPLLSRVIPPSPVLPDAAEPLIRAPVPSPAYVASPIPPTAKAIPALPSMNLDLLEVKPGQCGLVLRDDSGLLTEETLSDKVVIEINGQSMSLDDVQWLRKDLVYLGDDWNKNGRMSVKLTSSTLSK